MAQSLNSFLLPANKQRAIAIDKRVTESVGIPDVKKRKKLFNFQNTVTGTVSNSEDKKEIDINNFPKLEGWA